MKLEIIELNPYDAYTSAIKSLNKLYNTASGKKFIHHLIYAFLFDAVPVIYNTGVLFDCITRSKLNSYYTNESVPEEVRSRLNNNETKLGITASDELDEKLIPVRLAYTSPKSNKILGASELQALKDYVKSSSDQTILKLVNYINPHKKSNKKKSRSIKSGWTLEDSEELKSKLRTICQN